jgi:hypothetical protein
MPLSKTFFSPRIGVVADRSGVPWHLEGVSLGRNQPTRTLSFQTRDRINRSIADQPERES